MFRLVGEQRVTGPEERPQGRRGGKHSRLGIVRFRCGFVREVRATHFHAASNAASLLAIEQHLVRTDTAETFGSIGDSYENVSSRTVQQSLVENILISLNIFYCSLYVLYFI